MVDMVVGEGLEAQRLLAHHPQQRWYGGGPGNEAQRLLVRPTIPLGVVGRVYHPGMPPPLYHPGYTTLYTPFLPGYRCYVCYAGVREGEPWAQECYPIVAKTRYFSLFCEKCDVWYAFSAPDKDVTLT